MRARVIGFREHPAEAGLDVGRYRHPPPTCEPFLAAKPIVRCRRSRSRDQIDTRIKGHSYPQAWFEDAVGELLGKVGDLDDQALTEVVRLYGEDEGRPDELTIARIDREREEASQRLAKTRDIAAWQATMARLDAETEVATKPRPERRLEPAEVVAYLRSLPSLWTDAGPEGRQALASALFSKLEVEGYQRMTYELTPDAVELGLSAALPAQLETGGHTGGFGRGERGSASLTHLSARRPRLVLEYVTLSIDSTADWAVRVSRWALPMPRWAVLGARSAAPGAAATPADTHAGQMRGLDVPSIAGGRGRPAGHVVISFAITVEVWPWRTY